MANRIICIIFICNLLYINDLITQCSISEIDISASGCLDNENFSVEINFAISDPGASGFRIQGNGNDYGVFSYDSLPVVIDSLPGNCFTPWEFLIRDIDNPSCSNFADLGTICCSDNCEINNLTVQTGNCENFTYSAVLDFEPKGTLQTGFDLYVNDEVFGFYSYEDLPLELHDIPHGIDVLDRIKVCENDKPDCCQEISVLSPCTCAITDVQAALLPCNSEGEFGVIVDFNHQQTSAEGFTIGGNGKNYGNFKYDELPVKINRLSGDGTTNYEFLIVDLADVFCFDYTNIEALFCSSSDSCMLDNLQTSVPECTEDGNFYVYLDFDHFSTSSNGYHLSVNGDAYGSFLYEDLPIPIGPLKGDCESLYEFSITDLENAGCIAEVALESPVCCNSECNISNIQISELECENNTSYTFQLNFEYENTTNTSFDIFADNEQFIANYNYTELPVTVHSFPTRDLEFEFLRICDNDNPNCCRNFEFASQNCSDTIDCRIYEIRVDALICDQTSITSLLMNFEYEAVGEGFEVFGNGNHYGNFLYTELPISLEGLDIPCREALEFAILDLGNEQCRAAISVQEPECCQNICRIDSLSTEFVDCKDDTTFSLSISFNSFSTPSDSFQVISGERLVAKYAYEDLPVLIDSFPSRKLDYEFIQICDSQEENCCISSEFESPDCMTSATEEGLHSKNIKVYLNPNDQKLHIFSDEELSAGDRLSLFTFQSYKIMTKTIQNETDHISLDIPYLPTGIYILLIESSNSRMIMSFFYNLP